MRKWLIITSVVWLVMCLLLFIPTIVGLLLQPGRATDQILYLRTSTDLAFGAPFQMVAFDPDTARQQFAIKDNSAVHSMDGHPPILSANRLRWYMVTKDSIQIINSLTGEKIRTVPLRDPLTVNVGHGYYIAAQDISPDDLWYYQVYVTSPNDPHSMLIRLFSLKTGHALPTLISLPSYCWVVVQVKRDVFARCGNIFKPIDLNTQQVGPDVPLPIPEANVGTITLLPGGKLAYMTFDGTSVIIYDRITNTVLRTLSPSPALPQWDAATVLSPDAIYTSVDLQTSRDGSKLIMDTTFYNHSGPDHEQINVFDLHTGKAYPAFVTHDAYGAMEFTANGSTMVAVIGKPSDEQYADTYIEIDTETGKVLREVARPHEDIENVVLVP